MNKLCLIIICCFLHVAHIEGRLSRSVKQYSVQGRVTKSPEFLKLKPTKSPSLRSTLKPTRVPTTRQPSKTPTLRPRIATLSPVETSTCQSSIDEKTCSIDSNCKWFKIKACDYFQQPHFCETFEYGCQDKFTFCGIDKGTNVLIQTQCNIRGYPCKYLKGKCTMATNRPTITNNAAWNCNNLCKLANNGVCDDGRPGSKTFWCIRGSDCNDCGVAP